jgi:hypothetical protein
VETAEQSRHFVDHGILELLYARTDLASQSTCRSRDTNPQGTGQLVDRSPPHDINVALGLAIANLLRASALRTLRQQACVVGAQGNEGS